MGWISRLIGAVALSAMLWPAQADEGLLVEDAWVREGPPNAAVLGAFMMLRNTGDRPVEIVEATSPRFGRIELHLSRMEGGMAKMIRQESLTVPAGGTLELAPGGYHLMLFDPNGPVRAGQRIAFTLHTRDGAAVEAEAEVRKAMGAMGGMHHHGH